MKKVYRLLTLILAFTILSLCACGEKESAPADNSGNKAADSAKGELSAQETLFGSFYAQTLDGGDTTEEIFAQADLTMVNIWATFCGPCINEMPDLGELNREYKDKGFQIMGLISDVNMPGDETALQIVEETQADYTHMVASLDLQGGILKYVSVVPTTVFVDKEGNQVGDVYSGSRDKESWAEIIDALLSEVQ